MSKHTSKQNVLFKKALASQATMLRFENGVLRADGHELG